MPHFGGSQEETKAMMHTTWLIKPGDREGKVSVVARIDKMDGGNWIEEVERNWIADFDSVSQAFKCIEEEAGTVMSPTKSFLMAHCAVDQFVLEQVGNGEIEQSEADAYTRNHYRG